jgi:hypothetical protein
MNRARHAAWFLAGAAVAAGGAVVMPALADDPSAPAPIQACVRKDQVLLLAPPAGCDQGETPIKWGAEGPPGPKGGDGVADQSTFGAYAGTAIRSALAQPDLSHMTIEDAVALMFQIVSEDARQDLKGMLDDMSATRLKRKSLRDFVAAAKGSRSTVLRQIAAGQAVTLTRPDPCATRASLPFPQITCGRFRTLSSTRRSSYLAGAATSAGDLQIPALADDAGAQMFAANIRSEAQVDIMARNQPREAGLIGALLVAMSGR